MRLRYFLLLLIPFAALQIDAQILKSNGSIIQISAGGTIFCNGGISLSNSTQFTNNGQLTATKNSILPQAGDFNFASNSTVAGNGEYQIEQNWINDANFSGGTSEVILFGNTEQFITSTNGTVTTFNDLTLSGAGVGINRRKTLSNVNSGTGSMGVLQINNRELATENQSFEVANPSTSAILYDNTFGSEGFVSSIGGGYLVRNTNQTNAYFFPLGSATGTYRFRPIVLTPTNASNNSFNARLNNYNADNDGFFLAQHEAVIDQAQTLFYHSIERSSGAAGADIQIYFIPASDGDWLSAAHWLPTDTEWKDLTNTNMLGTSNFSIVEKTAWGFNKPGHPYVLVKNIEGSLVIPNVFTPNNDGANDEFSITSSNLTDYQLIILNRWGNLMFESNDPANSWDGTSDGKACPDGTYFYLLKAKMGSQEILKQGHLTLSQ
ncbi:MAG: gliding motility-associated C-terminal domain-containing protein [Bacteroidota bacterium]